MKPCCRHALSLGAAVCLACGGVLSDLPHTHTHEASTFVVNPGKLGGVRSTATASATLHDPLGHLGLAVATSASNGGRYGPQATV